MRRSRPWTLLTPAVLAFLLAAPATAVADKSGSSNWSGYAVHRAGTTFSHITGSWRQPQGSCAAGGPTYSAYWVGIGGYAQNSIGIEQLGTEFDCSAGGHAKLSAWYELLPAPVRRISMTVAPGDQMAGGVTIAGNNVTLTLQDLTRNESFSRTIFDRQDRPELGRVDHRGPVGVCGGLPLRGPTADRLRVRDLLGRERRDLDRARRARSPARSGGRPRSCSRGRRSTSLSRRNRPFARRGRRRCATAGNRSRSPLRDPVRRPRRRPSPRDLPAAARSPETGAARPAPAAAIPPAMARAPGGGWRAGRG